MLAGAIRGFIDDPTAVLQDGLKTKWLGFWSLEPPWPLATSNPQLLAFDLFFPFAPWSLVLFLGVPGLGVAMARGRDGAWLTAACLALFAGNHLLFAGSARERLPAEGYVIAFAAALVTRLWTLLPRLGRARAPAWAAVLALLLLGTLAEAGVQARLHGRSLRDPARTLATGEDLPLVRAGDDPLPVVGESRVALDRSMGRYLRVSFIAYRSGPPEAAARSGYLLLGFYDAEGTPLEWLDNVAYSLEALPPDRWTEVTFKTPVPPAAAACDLDLHPPSGGREAVLVDHLSVRYDDGNDPALEFLFPYQRSRE